MIVLHNKPFTLTELVESMDRFHKTAVGFDEMQYDFIIWINKEFPFQNIAKTIDTRKTTNPYH